MCPECACELAWSEEIDFKVPRDYSLSMSATFATLAETLRSCSTEEKLELKSVLERALIDERRREIKANGRRSMEELKRGKLKFSSSISELKKSLAK